MTAARRVLLIHAHPAFERARVCPALLQAAGAVEGVTVHDLYETYPDFLIDVEAEQQRLLEHDVVAFQFPFYWYSTPALVKEWLDLVLTHGFAYGHNGDALAGKVLTCALSTGGGAQAYGPRGGNRFTIEEFLRPLEATAHLCGMVWRPAYVVHGAALLLDEDLEAAARGWAERLAALRDDRAVEMAQ